MIEANKKDLPAKPHSQPGIVSTIISFVTIVLAVFWCVLCWIFVEQMFGATRIDSVARFSFSSTFFLVIGFLLHLMGVILGVIGWRSAETNAFFAICGTVLNSFLMLTDIVLIVLLFFIFVIIAVPVH